MIESRKASPKHRQSRIVRCTLARFPRQDVDPANAVLAGDLLFRRTEEAIEPRDQRDIDKAELTEERDELSLRESAANSTSP